MHQPTDDELSIRLRRALLDDEDEQSGVFKTAGAVLADAFFRARPLQAGAGPQHVAAVIPIASRAPRRSR